MNIISVGISFVEILAILLIYNILINYNLFNEITKKIILSIITSLVYMLFIEIDKKNLSHVTSIIKKLDKKAFIVVNETKLVQNGFIK